MPNAFKICYNRYMNETSIEFNKQLELDVMVTGLTEVTKKYVEQFEWAMLDEIVIPKGITRIGNNAFMSCTGLTSVTICEGVTRIGSYAFCDCGGLLTINLPDSLTSIGEGAFEDCVNLVNIRFPDNLVTIGEWACYGCVSLTRLAIPKNVINIGVHMFADCYSLESVVFKDRTISEICCMEGYPWNLSLEKIHAQVS